MQRTSKYATDVVTPLLEKQASVARGETIFTYANTLYNRKEMTA
jgi:hypothetical protein